MRLRDVWKAWDCFWFTLESPAPICLFRIFYGIFVFLTAFLWIPDLTTWFGPRGIVSIATVKAYEETARFSLFFILPQTNEWLMTLFVLLLMSAVFVALGFCTRISTFILLVLLVSFDHRNPVMLNSGDTLLRVTGFILLMAPANAMFSLDRLIALKQGKALADPWQIRASMWTTRLLQLQIAAVYCQASWAKFMGDTWWYGTAVYYSSRLADFQRFPVPYLLDHLWSIKLLTWGALFVEFAMWTLIWVKEFRYWVILAAILLHLGIDWSMNIPLFEYIMITSYIVFVDPEDIKRVMLFLRSVIRKEKNLAA